MRKNKKGFGVVEIILIIVVIGLIVAVGWLFFDRQKDKASDSETATTNQQTEKQKTDTSVNTEENVPSGWFTYENSSLGFSFSHPSEYGKVKEDSEYGSENQNALLYTFYFEKMCPTCNSGSPFTVDMASDGIVEIGATTANFGGVGTSRPLAISSGFSGEGNFQANGVKGLLKTTTDDWNETVRTTIEFNLTKSSSATGIMFMTNDKPGGTKNAENLKSIAKTFKLLP